MKPPVRRQLEQVAEEIQKAKEEARNLAKVTEADLYDRATKYNRAPSGVLAGVVGGVIGSAGGFALTTVGGATLVLSGPLGLAAGVALGVLYFRGASTFKLERARRKLNQAIAPIKAELNALPENVPEEVVDDLWEGYREFLRTYRKVVVSLQLSDSDVYEGEPLQFIEAEVLEEK